VPLRIANGTQEEVCGELETGIVTLGSTGLLAVPVALAVGCLIGGGVAWSVYLIRVAAPAVRNDR
jgi:hypothetical protein